MSYVTVSFYVKREDDEEKAGYFHLVKIRHSLLASRKLKELSDWVTKLCKFNVIELKG